MTGKTDFVGCELGCCFWDMRAFLISSVPSHAHLQNPHRKGVKWSVLKKTESFIF